MRDRIGGYPYEVEKKEGKIILKFFHGGKKVENPNAVKMTLLLTKEDIKKLSNL